MLGTKFKTLRMKEDEIISSYNERFSEVANESYSLGNQYPIRGKYIEFLKLILNVLMLKYVLLKRLKILIP